MAIPELHRIAKQVGLHMGLLAESDLGCGSVRTSTGSGSDATTVSDFVDPLRQAAARGVVSSRWPSKQLRQWVLSVAAAGAAAAAAAAPAAAAAAAAILHGHAVLIHCCFVFFNIASTGNVTTHFAVM